MTTLTLARALSVLAVAVAQVKKVIEACEKIDPKAKTASSGD